jgi:hypothetical protein
MGYACPVCGDPQQDARHLADHLAFQALTHGDDHESWLDDHAPGWAEGGPAELAPRLEGLADEAEYEVVFEDTTDTTDAGDDEVYDPDRQGEPTPQRGDRHDHARSHGHDHDHGHDHTRHRDGVEPAGLDPEARAVVENARELTREMLADGDDDSSDATDGTAGDTGDRTDDHETADGRE